MKILFDTNVVLDVLMDRQPFSDAAVELFSYVEEGTITGYLCGTTITTVYYIASKTIGAAGAREGIRRQSCRESYRHKGQETPLTVIMAPMTTFLI